MSTNNDNTLRFYEILLVLMLINLGLEAGDPDVVELITGQQPY
jgi:hypothetical protein